VGCAIARDLSRYALRIGVFEKESDVSLGISCRNSGVLHAGINCEPGSLRARLSVRGNAMMDLLCSDLKVPLKRIGKLTVALDKADLSGLHKQREQGLANGVPGMELMDNTAMQRIQPGINGILGLWTPSSAIISPYGLTISLAESACMNGVDFFLNEEVSSIKRDNELFSVVSNTGKIAACRVLINASGLHADEVGRMAGLSVGRIWACRGEYYVLDKRLSGALRTLVYPVPGTNDPGLGIHLTPTVDGNILIGPSAAYIPMEDREDYRTTREIMSDLRREGLRLLPGLAASDFIRSFSGNRPKQTSPEEGGNADFTVEEYRAIPGFIHLQGIESPGLTSAPAIAEMVRGFVRRRLRLVERDDFIPIRRSLRGFFSTLPLDERKELISCEPEYGEIVCRCEQITKKEIRDAIENPFGAKCLAAVKYRTRAMMGRCQGGFCIPRITRLLRDEYGYEAEDYYVRGVNARMFSGNVYQSRKEAAKRESS